MISIDPNNHTFDPHPDCTSNQVDECGSCDGPGKDCRGTCHPNSPLSIANFCWNSSPYVGYGSEINLTFESATNEGEEETYILEAGCRNFIGYDSDFDYSHDNGVDLCGECYIGDLIEGDAYNPNYSCQGCMDQHADNYDPTALFSDGSCSFQLYAGDVNRDGVVNEQDIYGNIPLIYAIENRTDISITSLTVRSATSFFFSC